MIWVFHTPNCVLIRYPTSDECIMMENVTDTIAMIRLVPAQNDHDLFFRRWRLQETLIAQPIFRSCPLSSGIRCCQSAALARAETIFCAREFNNRRRTWTWRGYNYHSYCAFLWWYRNNRRWRRCKIYDEKHS